jgi:lipopolysaccharide/colanic/teichoic acid biosynthesis glycosyltransferase
MDVVLGTIAALVALPVILVLAFGVAVTLRTSPFFVQRRVGREGRPFRFIKLRTLPRSAPTCATKYELVGIQIPRFTRALRRFHLDELPQLLLVPFGLLSLVGPRPEMLTMHDEADHAFAAERVQVRPGCTGLWQISDAASGLIWEAPQYDRHYIRNCSIALDVWILWRTLFVLTGRAEPIGLSGVPQALAASEVSTVRALV